MNLEVRTEYL